MLHMKNTAFRQDKKGIHRKAGAAKRVSRDGSADSRVMDGNGQGKIDVSGRMRVSENRPSDHPVPLRRMQQVINRERN